MKRRPDIRKHALILATLIAVTGGGLVAIFLNVHLVPAAASSQAKPIDALFFVMFSIAGVILALCLVTLIYSVVAFRSRRGEMEDGPPIAGNTPLEMMWTLVPLAIVMALSIYGTVALYDITKAAPAQSEMEVQVTAMRWTWRFQYPEYNVTTTELWLPVDRPILFKLHSVDVIHSFWVPQFRVKQDAVPGMETYLRVTPTQLGEYKLVCAELCGLAHSLMVAPVKVVTEPEFQQWVEKQK